MNAQHHAILGAMGHAVGELKSMVSQADARMASLEDGLFDRLRLLEERLAKLETANNADYSARETLHGLELRVQKLES